MIFSGMSVDKISMDGCMAHIEGKTETGVVLMVATRELLGMQNDVRQAYVQFPDYEQWLPTSVFKWDWSRMRYVYRY